MNVNKYINNLIKLKKSKNMILSTLAKYLIDKINQKKLIGGIVETANDNNISCAMVTKCVKKLEFSNYKELLFIHKLSIKNVFFKNKKDISQYTSAANILQAARKIFFVGVSSSYLINIDFANKLERLDYWVCTPMNKYEQIGKENLLTNADVMIVTSFSLQHIWMIDLLKKTKAKTICITSTNLDNINLHVNYYFEIDSTESLSAFRIVSTDGRNKAHNILDSIFSELLKMPGHKLLMKSTRYN